jgi:hypothetical protein
LKGNFHDQFLEGWVGVIPPSYSTIGRVIADPTRTQALRQLSQRLARTHGLLLGDAIQVAGRNEPGVHGKSLWRVQLEAVDLLAHVARNTLDGGLHLGHDALGFIDALQATLAEAFFLGHSANGVHLLADIGGNELGVAPHATIEIDHRIDLTDAADTLGDLCALGADAIAFPAGDLRIGAGRLSSLVFLRLVEWLLCLSGGLDGSALLGGHGA